MKNAKKSDNEDNDQLLSVDNYFKYLWKTNLFVIRKYC